MIESRHHFWYASTFTLGLSIIRFTYADHPPPNLSLKPDASAAALARRPLAAG